MAVLKNNKLLPKCMIKSFSAHWLELCSKPPLKDRVSISRMGVSHLKMLFLGDKAPHKINIWGEMKICLSGGWGDHRFWEKLILISALCKGNNSYCFSLVQVLFSVFHHCILLVGNLIFVNHKKQDQSIKINTRFCFWTWARYQSIRYTCKVSDVKYTLFFFFFSCNLSL